MCPIQCILITIQSDCCLLYSKKLSKLAPLFHRWRTWILSQVFRDIFTIKITLNIKASFYFLQRLSLNTTVVLLFPTNMVKVLSQELCNIYTKKRFKSLKGLRFHCIKVTHTHTHKTKCANIALCGDMFTFDVDNMTSVASAQVTMPSLSGLFISHIL